jgi:hypothetical protein
VPLPALGPGDLHFDVLIAPSMSAPSMFITPASSEVGMPFEFSVLSIAGAMFDVLMVLMGHNRPSLTSIKSALIPGLKKHQSNHKRSKFAPELDYLVQKTIFGSNLV